MNWGFDLGSFIPAAAVAAVGLAVYFVRTSAESAAATKVAAAAEKLIGRIEALSTVISQMTTSLKVGEERHTKLAEDVEDLEKSHAELAKYAHDRLHGLHNFQMTAEGRISQLERRR